MNPCFSVSSASTDSLDDDGDGDNEGFDGSVALGGLLDNTATFSEEDITLSESDEASLVADVHIKCLAVLSSLSSALLIT